MQIFSSQKVCYECVKQHRCHHITHACTLCYGGDRVKCEGLARERGVHRGLDASLYGKYRSFVVLGGYRVLNAAHTRVCLLAVSVGPKKIFH